MRNFHELTYSEQFEIIANIFIETMKDSYDCSTYLELAWKLAEKSVEEGRQALLGTEKTEAKWKTWYYDQLYSKYSKGRQIPRPGKKISEDCMRIFDVFFRDAVAENSRRLEEITDRWLSERPDGPVEVNCAGTEEKIWSMLRSCFGTAYDGCCGGKVLPRKYKGGVIFDGCLFVPSEAAADTMDRSVILRECMESNDDFLSPYYAQVRFYSAHERPAEIPYKPIYSYGQMRRYIFDASFCLCVREDVSVWNIKGYIDGLLNGLAVEEREKVIRYRYAVKEREYCNRGFKESPDLLWLKSAVCINGERPQLVVRYGHTGEGGYRMHKIWYDLIMEKKDDPEYRDVINDQIAQLLANPSESLTDIPGNETFDFLRCGGGIWIVTSDGYLAVSKRSKVNVDVPGVISYSSSGSFEFAEYNGTWGPFAQMCKEVFEELGISIDPDKIFLTELGIDLSGFWVQHSFVTKVPFSAVQIAECHSSFAVHNAEFTLMFIPFEREEIIKFCYDYGMEAGALYSLMNLARHMEDICDRMRGLDV